jgi:hypothetical protein
MENPATLSTRGGNKKGSLGSLLEWWVVLDKLRAPALNRSAVA